DVERGFGLIHAAAAGQRENMDHEDRNHQARERRHQDETQGSGGDLRAQQIDLAAREGGAKANYCQAGEDSDKYGNDEEEPLFAKYQAQQRTRYAESGAMSAGLVSYRRHRT